MKTFERILGLTAVTKAAPAWISIKLYTRILLLKINESL